jgi:uncharacterized membrane protein
VEGFAILIGLGLLGYIIIAPLIALVRAHSADRRAAQNQENSQKLTQRIHALETQLKEIQGRVKAQATVLESALQESRTASAAREATAPAAAAPNEPSKPAAVAAGPEAPPIEPPRPVATVAPPVPALASPPAAIGKPTVPPLSPAGPTAPPPAKMPGLAPVPPALTVLPAPVEIPKPGARPVSIAPPALLPIESPLAHATRQPLPAPPIAPPHFEMLGAHKPSPKETARRVLNMEEVLGTDWLNKIGMSILVIGIALFLAYEMRELGPAGKVLVGYVVSGGLLGAGIFYERNERYRLLARVGIGGGWALTFFTTYAMYHVPPARVLNSQAVDLVLLLGVAAAMVVHTLRYNSQVVTGLALLLGFTTVTISKDNVYSLSAGAILALALVIIVLRRKWYELEICGLLASYLNHYYWLRPIIEPMGEHHHPFPEFVPSAALLVFYWLVFRVSYLLRRGLSEAEEKVSTVAALLNSFLLLGLMKYQSVHPQWAFRFLLLLGAVEFVLGQLPIARLRRTAFVVLTVVGATLMVVAIPFKYSGETLPILWLAEAEALFLAGVFLEEILFCRLALLASMLVAFQLDRFALQQIFDPQWGGFHSGELVRGIIEFTATTLIFYGDAHWLSRRYAHLAESRFENSFLRLLSYVAGVTAVIGVWWLTPEQWVAVVLAALGLTLAVLGWRTSLREFIYQAHAVAFLSFLRVLVVNLGDEGIHHHLMLRLVTVGLTAVMFYACAYCSGLARTSTAQYVSTGHTWTASLLVGLLAWYELEPIGASQVWTLLGVALVVIGRFRRLPYLRAQAFVAFALSFQQLNFFALQQIFDPQWKGIHGAELLRGIMEFTGTTLVFYGSAHSLRCGSPDLAESRLETAILHSLSWASGVTAVIGIWWLAPEAWAAVGFAALGLALIILDSRTNIRDFVYQAHAASALAFLRVLAVNLGEQNIHQHLQVRLVTVGLTAAMLYASAHWSGQPRTPAAQYISSGHTWTASLLAGLLAWYELEPVSVALAWTLIGLGLFETGRARRLPDLRLQAYLAFAFSFLRLFFVNFNAVGMPGELSPRFYSTMPLALAFFYVYGVLDTSSDAALAPDRRWKAAEVLCFLGTFTVAGWARFELEADWVVAAWAAMIVVLVALAWRYEKRIFLHQGLLLGAAVLMRNSLHNFYERSNFPAPFWQSRSLTVGVTIALLFAVLPFAFRLRRSPEKQAAIPSPWRRAVDAIERRPEQVFFFIPFFLLTVLLALEVPKGLVTVAWGVEAVAVFLFALAVGQRSYRLSGLGLLLICVGKIVLLDFWGLQLRDKMLTCILLGAAVLGVSFLYTRYREVIRRYL